MNRKKRTGIVRTATGIFAASVAKDAFGAEQDINDPAGRLAAKAVGSVSAAVAFHCLKDDAKDVLGTLHGGEQRLELDG